MNHTPNLNLPQWDASDFILRTDFNSAMSAIDTAAAGGAKIAVGTYTGSGTCGSSSPNTLTFSFAPKIVLIWLDRYTPSSTGGAVTCLGYWGSTFAILLSGTEWMYVNDGTANSSAVHLSFSGNTVQYYNDGNKPALQWNTENQLYHYLALG